MATELARQTGGSAGRLASEWESLRGQKLSRAVDLYRNRGPSRSGIASSNRYDGVDFDATRQGLAGRPEKSFVPSMDDASSSMMSKAIRSPFFGASQQKIGGNLGVTIDSTGAPGFSVRAKGDDIFSPVTLRRGTVMDSGDGR